MSWHLITPTVVVMSLAQKVVIVTGASSGIGAATAEIFAKQSAKVVIVGRNAANLKETQATCVKHKSDVFLLQANVLTDAERIVKETIARYGRIDVLVNNAGILAAAPLLDLDMQQFDEILNTNLRAVVQLTQLAAPHLITTKGSVVNVSSCAGLRPFTGSISYCVSKAALDQFTKCASLELAPLGVRVNSVNPGVVITDIHRRSGMLDADYAAYLERAKATHALGRVGDVYEVAEAIAFLASDKASFTTGALLPVDGGKHNITPR